MMLPGFFMPNCDPVEPYIYVLTRLYRLLLSGERVMKCEPVMYRGEHVHNMYDIEITDTSDPARSPPRRTIRLYPTPAWRWKSYGGGK